MTIKATIHFLDGQTLEKSLGPIQVGQDEFSETLARDMLGLWLRNTPWYDLANNTFLPASQIARVTWEEIRSE